VEGIERCLGEVVTSMIEIVSSSRSGDPIPLVSQYHDFDHYLTQLISIDPDMALSCLKQYKELSLGPKNKRRPDNNGLVSPSLSLFIVFYIFHFKASCLLLLLFIIICQCDFKYIIKRLLQVLLSFIDEKMKELSTRTTAGGVQMRG
jgi:hypothetical protein